MPKVTGIGRSKKRKKLAPVAPTEPMPDKEGELIEDEKEAAEEPEFDDEVIEEATGTVMAAVVENMIDVDSMVKTQLFRLHKREIRAAAAREAMELKFGYGKAGDFGESAAWFMEYDEAQEELLDFQDEWGVPDCPGCGPPRAVCSGCCVDCRYGPRHRRYAWVQGYRCKLRCSPASPFIGE